MMKRIEELLNFSENKQRYSHLKSNLIEHHLAVFLELDCPWEGKPPENGKVPFL